MNGNDTLQMFNDFMEADLIIKRIISNCEPKGDEYNIETIINYQNKLLKALQEIKIQFSKLIICFEDSVQSKLNQNSIQNQIDSIFKVYKEKLLNCDLTYDNLKNFYNTCFVSMDKELIFELREKCKGYSFVFLPTAFLKNATSINEILHIFHVCFINDENKYQTIPTIETKLSQYGDEISLRGITSKNAKQIFDNLPKKVGTTDIVTFPNGKIIMMIRDVGHATTIEIDDEKEDGNTWIRYYIPNIYNNLEMINKIEGINIQKNENGKPISATGSIEVKDKNIAKNVTELIEKIPRDDDMTISYERK